MSETYRSRIYEQYGSRFQDATETFDKTAVERVERAYAYYFRGWLPKSKEARIVDVACGNGKLLYFYQQAGFTNISGIDISPEQISLAQEITPNVINANALDFLESQTTKYDLISGIDIIEHLHKQEVMRFIEICRNALKPNGRIILQTPNADSPFGMTHRYGDFTHEVCFNPNLLRRLLKMNGFGSIEAREQEPVPFSYSLKSTARYFSWQAIRKMLRLWSLVETGYAGSDILTRVFLISGVKQ